MPKPTTTLIALGVLLTPLLTGCVSAKTRHGNVSRLIQSHGKGFGDAVNASPEAESFVRDALNTVAGLEGELIRE